LKSAFGNYPTVPIFAVLFAVQNPQNGLKTSKRFSIMPGILGRKIGMTSVFGPTGVSIAVTVIEAGPCVVTQVKSQETDGYKALQLSFGEKKEKNTPKPFKVILRKPILPQREISLNSGISGQNSM
jgi:hypothetical protein